MSIHSLTKRGTVWWVDFRLPSGRRVRRTTGTTDYDEARKRGPSIIAEELSAAGGTASLNLEVALRRTYREHWSRAKSAREMGYMVDTLVRGVGHWQVRDASYQRLKDYGEALLRENLAPATVNRRLSALGVVLRDCQRRGEISQRPDTPHYREDNRKERFMSQPEEVAVLGWLWGKSTADASDPEGTGEWAYVHALAVVLLDTGMRYSETLAAQRESVAGASVLNLRNGETKSGRGRVVPLTARARAAWASLVESPWHPRLKLMGAHAAWSWVSYRWERAVAAAGCPDVTLHILRHTCASRLIQRGVTIYTVSKWLGHSSVKVTERYAKLAPDNMAQALAALEGRPVPVVERLHDTTPSRTGEDSPDLGHTSTG